MDDADYVNVEMSDESTDLYHQLRSIVGIAVRNVVAAPFYDAEDGTMMGVVQVTNKCPMLDAEGKEIARKFEREDVVMLSQLCKHIKHSQANSICFHHQVDKARISTQIADSISCAVQADGSMEQMITALSRYVESVVSCDLCNVFLISTGIDSTTLYTIEGSNRIQLSIDDGIIGFVAREGTKVDMSEPSRHPNYSYTADQVCP
jgi:hypothetical protein